MTMPNTDPELSEKDFINNNGFKKNPFPAWLWLFLITTVIALLWGVGNWYTNKINILFRQSPFLQVTNRSLSLFFGKILNTCVLIVRKKAITFRLLNILIK